MARVAPVSVHVAHGASAEADQRATISSPRLWGPRPLQVPNRYVLVTTVEQGGAVVDSYETPFGIRTLKFDPDQGFLINGVHVPIQGVCMHHDLGPLGTAVNDRALRRQIEMLVDMGGNAIRTSHNPPTPELLELADEMGFLVMDEMTDIWIRAEDAQRLPPALPRLARAGSARAHPPRPQPSVRVHVEHRQRGRRAAPG